MKMGYYKKCEFCGAFHQKNDMCSRWELVFFPMAVAFALIALAIWG